MFGYFIIGILCGFIGAWGISVYGPYVGLVDNPVDRSSHDRPTPKGGGIGIWVAFLFAATISNLPFILTASVSVLSLVSFWGDFKDISRRFRLLVQVASAIVWVWVLRPDIGIPTGIFAVFCILTTVNIYNFMDGINGLASTTGFIAFGLMVCFGWVTGPVSFLAITLCGACLGFLPLNLRGKVFLGDVGSILIGFVFSQMVLAASETWLLAVIFSGMIFPFYFDGITTIIIRLKSKENIFKPHRRHLYQLLVNQAGNPHWKITGVYALCQLLVCLGLWAIFPHGEVVVGLFYLITILVFGPLSIFIRRSVS